ncbi:MAG: ABC transporter permease [Fervidicoccaceae archaeon]
MDVKLDSLKRLGSVDSTIILITRSRTGMLGLSMISSILFISLIIGMISPYSPIKGNLADALKPPSLSHIFGTDELGRDLFTRTFYGVRTSILISFLGAGIGAALGTLLGLMAGYLGGIVDYSLMRLSDALLSIPSILIAIALVAILGPGTTNIIIAIAFGLVPAYMRLTRGIVVQVKNLEYVIAAKLLGLSSTRIMFRHILPNISYLTVSQFTLDLGGAILMAAGLGFLGLGVQPPQPELGTIIGTAKNYLGVAPYLILFPGLVLLLLSLGFNLLGNTLRDIIDPSSRVRMK